MKYKVIQKRRTNTVLPPLEITEENLEIAREFFECAKALEGAAVGLAAPQTGLDLRMCAVSAPHWILAINPKITQRLGNDFKTEEGCLTWPNSYVIADRYSNVEVEFYNLETKAIEKQWYSGLPCLIWQHEIDHLDGVEEKLVPQDTIHKMYDPKVGRNDACPCESGKKYKKCCFKLRTFRIV